ncbi:MAG: DNA cytosine methyltransferase [Bdellovibrionaceae bacterium]|nr:DNA cytosine methyltransferase [Pseudobdellovibrionaceae bacterium]
MPSNSTNKTEFSSLDFFAGSGLVTSGLKPYFNTVWANDICSKKAKVFTANHPPELLQLDDIKNISGQSLPNATLAWASFPCVDLSLAGNRQGLRAERSGLYWEWLRIVDETKVMPPILAVENVEGLFSSAKGEDYKALHRSLTARGYRVGPLLLDAKHWVPQSRVRAFVIAVKSNVDIQNLTSSGPSWLQPTSVLKAVEGLEDVVYWNIKEPKKRREDFLDVVDFDAPCDSEDKRKKNISMVPKRHLDYLLGIGQKRYAAPGYKRTRNGKQVLELRFDGLAGCLRVPRGGSSRQYVVIKNGDKLNTRLLTTEETVRLMGAPKGFNTIGTYNEIYAAMGDAVAYPVVKFLSANLLHPLGKKLKSGMTKKSSIATPAAVDSQTLFDLR